MNPRYPIFVPTKGRFESRLTISALEEMRVPYKAVVEPQEVEKYVLAGVRRQNILILPHYDKGLVATRNWIWDHAAALGTPRFWTFDDNIKGFFRLNNNLKVPCHTGAIFRAAEDFVERYENVAIAGFHYFMFASRKTKMPPFNLNRRVYSNMLIKTDIPFRNEGFYNDDTDLCLRVLKAGWCTVLFSAFLAYKMTTMTVSGGMTPHYQKGLDGKAGPEGDGRYRMAKELCDKHPDVARISWKFGHWQHHVDYSPFKRNQLILRKGVQIPQGVNNYGMVLQVDGQGAKTEARELVER